MSKFAFTGTGVALITPFRKQDTIDFSRLENLINTIIASGVEYIVALGTTSEAATMTDNERSALRDFIIETTAGRVPVVLGVGGNNTRQIAAGLFDGHHIGTIVGNLKGGLGIHIHTGASRHIV